MGAYILDGMRFKEGAFTAVWATLAVANLALTYNTLFVNEEYNSLLSTLALILSMLTLFLTGLWATLQFKWIQLQYPAVVLAFEKMLLLGCLPIPSTMLAWGIAITADMHSASFLLAGIVCLLYFMFGVPLPSSFQLSSSKTTRSLSHSTPPVQTIVDGISSFLFTTFLPTAVYTATHSHVIFQWVHIWSIFLLASGPVLFIMSIPHGTWWLGRSATADGIRRLVLLLSFGTFLAGIEGRIVFFSFGQYIRLAAPWSYIAITIGLYGAGALVLLLATGMLGVEIAGVLLGPILMISSSVGALIVGMSVWAVPAPLLAAAGLAMFYDSRSMRDYIFFFLGACATGGYFLWQHFWFLDITLDGMKLRNLCLVLGAAMASGFLVPGMVLSGWKGRPVEIFLLAQAGLMMVAEEHLYAGDHADITYNIHPMFPSFLVVGTTAAGIAVAKKLFDTKTIGEVASYALQCVYGAKIVMLIVPEARLTVPILGLTLAVTPPVLLQKSSEPEQQRRRHRLPAWQGLALASAVVLAVVAARFAIFDMLRLLLNRRPSEALAAGSLVLAAGAGCIPLVGRYYRGSVQIKRVLLLTISSGLLLALLRPPLPVRGGARCPHLPFGLCPRLWNEEHAPEHEQDDVAIYGDGLRRREHWPLWYLLVAGISGIAAATSPVAVKDATPMRLMQATASAALVGAYMAMDFFPGLRLVQIVILASALLVAASTVFLQLPTRGGMILLPIVSFAWWCSFPIAMVVQAASALPPLPFDMERLYPDVIEEEEVYKERKTAVRSAVLACFAAESLLLAFAMKLRVSAAGSGSQLPGSSMGATYSADTNYIDKAASFLGQCIPSVAMQPGSLRPMLKGSTNVAYHKLVSEGMGWVPTACNIVTLMCFVMCWMLNEAFTRGDPIAALLLAPITLLLCQDPLLFRGLHDGRRYFPPALGVVGVLLVHAGGYLFVDLLNVGHAEFMFKYDGIYLVKNIVALVLCLPTQAEFLWYMWSRNRVGAVRAMLPAVMSSAAIYFAEISSIRLMAGLNVVVGLFMAASAQHKRHVSRKVI